MHQWDTVAAAPRTQSVSDTATAEKVLDNRRVKRGPRSIILAALTFALSFSAVTAGAGVVLLPAVTSAPIATQSGYDASEQFCGTIGIIQYVAIKKRVELRIRLAAVKANRQYSVAWQNNAVRGYTIGVFSTTGSGAVRRGSLRLFRAGEVRGIGVPVYYLVGNAPHGLERFKPCAVTPTNSTI
jgi:hypothetical protein